jgi:hypothetical protein
MGGEAYTANVLIAVLMLVWGLDVCPFSYLVGQAGWERGGKTFSGVLCRRDLATNLVFYPYAW